MSNPAYLAAQIERGALLSETDRKATAVILRQVAEAEPKSARKARRDTALRQLAADHFPHLSHRAQSAEIRKAALRYEASGWRHDQHKVTNPRPLGTLEASLWAALSAYPAVPQDRQMRVILAT